ncbi:MAG: hypothetical protein RLZ70_60 [Verrucomicrobiota bacterium]|jgi:hypothetical protein
MPPALSPAARTRLASISKQLKAKFPDSDSRLAAVVYAVYACQAARQNGDNLPRLMSATQVALPDYLNGVSALDYFLNEEADGSVDQQPLAYRASRLINDLASLNAASLDFTSNAKLSANWMELPARELPFQLLVLDKIADPAELIELDPVLPSLVFGLLIRTDVNDSERPVVNVPPALSGLIAKAFALGQGQAALDLTFGLGGMTADSMGENSKAAFFAQESDPLQALLGWLRIQIMPGAESALVQVGDSLTHAFANLANTRPVDLAYVYQVESGPKVDILKLMSQTSEPAERLIVVCAAAESRLKQGKNELAQDEQGLVAASYHKESKQRELEEFVKIRIPAVQRVIQQSKEGGDLRENSDYKKARKELEALTSHARAIEDGLRDMEYQFRERQARHENLKRTVAHLQAEYDEAEARLRTARREFTAESLSLLRNDGRDLKLIRHALEIVTSSGTVVAVVSGRNLIRPPSRRFLRSYLTVEQNWLDTVVELPRGIAGAGERVAMLVFRKGRKDKDVLFIDASRIDAVVKAGAEDSVIDIAAPESSVVRRQRLEELPEAYVARLVEIIRDRVEYDGVSAKVEASVALGESDLRPQQYLRALVSARVTIEKLRQKLTAASEQTRKASAELQASRAALGLAPLNPQSGPAAPRPSGS